MPRLSLSLLGPFAATLDGQSLLPFRSNKVQALLTYLVTEEAFRPGVAHQREALMALLWPDYEFSSAQTNLRQTLYRLRQSIPLVQAEEGSEAVPLVLANRQMGQINPQASYELDVTRFIELQKSELGEDELAAALGLYRGDFLSDFYLPDSSEFEDWVGSRRQELRRLALDGLQRLVGLHLERDCYEEAEAAARRQLEIDALRERTHRQLMEALARSGRRNEALAHYRKLRVLLEEELGVEPATETEALVAAIESGELRKRQEAPLVVEQAAPKPRNNLSAQPTPLIGRQEELVALETLITNPDIRLITIIGLGGMGKTRLALAAAERQLEVTDQRFPDGVFFVPLAPLSSGEQIALAIVESLELTLSVEGGLEQALLAYVRNRRLLLVLDNFEHLIEGVELLAAMLHAAPHLHLLVTSRERLNLRGEHVFRLEGLALPRPAALDGLNQYPAVQLFLERARSVEPGLKLTQDELEQVVDICRQVGGMPLAIELAAAWADTLPVAEITHELEQGLEVLATEMRDVPERQRSVRAAFDHTWQRLDEGERALFVQLTVFRGGFTRMAAKEVTGATPRALSRLVSKSLLQHSQERDRYDIHELLRQYGAEVLAEDLAREVVIRDRHSTYFCAWLAEQATRLRGVEQGVALVEIEVDSENIRAAWDWAVDHNQVGRLASGMDTLGLFYQMRSRYEVGQAVFQKATNRLQVLLDQGQGSTQTTVVLVRLYGWQGVLSWDVHGRWITGAQLAKVPVQKGLSLLDHPTLTTEDVRKERAFLLHHLGRMMLPGNIAQAKQQLEQSLTLYRSVGDRAGEADVLYELSFVAASLGNYAEGRAYLAESVELYRLLGDQRRSVLSRTALGLLTKRAADYDEARSHFETAHSLARRCGYQSGAADALHHIGALNMQLGEFEAAIGSLQEALRIFHAAGNRSGELNSLVLLAGPYLFAGRSKEAIYSMTERLKIGGEALLEGWDTVELARLYLHDGQYQAAAARIEADFQGREIPADVWNHAWRILGWVALARGQYKQASNWLRKSINAFAFSLSFWYVAEWLAWSQAPFALALHHLGQRSQAREQLYDALWTTVEIRMFIPLLHLIPVVSVLLVSEEEQNLRLRAVELYALAESHPFIANSQLFRDIAGRYVEEATALLPPDVVKETRARGSDLDWWQTAKVLLEELAALGWSTPK